MPDEAKPRISGRIKIQAARSWESLRTLRDRIAGRLEECKRDVQARQTGASVHLAANISAAFYGNVHHEMDRTNLALLPILAYEYPGVVEESARFLELISYVIAERSDGGKEVTPAEMATVRASWADLRAVIDTYVEHLGGIVEDG